jgi:hypothetical protein
MMESKGWPLKNVPMVAKPFNNASTNVPPPACRAPVNVPSIRWLRAIHHHMGINDAISAAALPTNDFIQPRTLASASTPIAAMGAEKTGPT